MGEVGKVRVLLGEGQRDLGILNVDFLGLQHEVIVGPSWITFEGRQVVHDILGHVPASTGLR